MKKTTYSVVGFGGLRGAMVVCAALTAGSLFVSCMGMKGGGSGGEVTGVGGSSLSEPVPYMAYAMVSRQIRKGFQ